MDAVQEYMASTPVIAQKVLQRTIQNAARRAQGRLATKVTKATGLRRSSMKRRLRRYPRSDGVSQLVWFGANAVPVSSLMSASQAAAQVGKGLVQASGKVYPNSFMLRSRGGVVSMRRLPGGRLERLTEPIKAEVDAAINEQAGVIGPEVQEDFVRRMEEEL